MADQTRPRPSLPREALHRIEEKEKAAQELYAQDKWPHFPTNPQYSFLEESIFRSIEQVLGYLRVLAEELLDAHLKEYLEFAPADLLASTELLTSVTDRVTSIVDQLWEGYGVTLFQEPTSRRARYTLAVAMGTIAEHPELEPWRYPSEEQWAEFSQRMAEPDSKMADLNARHEATVQDVLKRKMLHYHNEAILRLPNSGEEIRTTAGTAEAATPQELSKLTWDDVAIRFLSDHRVQIKCGGRNETKNYAELGFEDGRSKRKPISAWETLQKLAQGSGDVAVSIHNRKSIETRIKVIRKRFRREFSIDDDPFEYIPRVGYHAQFKISWSPAAET